MTTSQEWAERLAGYIPEEPQMGDGWDVLAERAEERGEWAKAKEYWYRKAEEARQQQVRGDILAYYCRREDHCGREVEAAARYERQRAEDRAQEESKQ